MCRIYQIGSGFIPTHEEAVKKISELNTNFTVLSEFKGWREKITRQCNVCGDIREVHARSLIEKDKNGKVRGCAICVARERANKVRKTHEQFIKELAEINPNIEVLGEYITTSDKIKCKCLIDGHKWETTPHSLLEGHGCPECANRKQNRRTNKDFVNEMKEKFPDITPLEEYRRMNESMKFRCEVCGYEWNTAPSLFLKDKTRGCPKCNNHYKLSEQDVVERLKESNPLVKYLYGFDKVANQATFQCLKCGYIWNTLVNSVLCGKGCPKCNISHGERTISKILDNYGIEYIAQHKFDGCKDIRCLSFDFYLPSLNTCIEYDGAQHFMPVRFGKEMTQEQMENKFESQQRRDKIKNDYCLENNIELIRIPYTEYNNIETILNKYLS